MVCPVKTTKPGEHWKGWSIGRDGTSAQWSIGTVEHWRSGASGGATLGGIDHWRDEHGKGGALARVEHWEEWRL